jgi:hypothetical protein
MMISRGARRRLTTRRAGLFPKKEEIMTIGERDLEAARQQILQRMQKPQSQQALSQLRQELRAIDIELDNVKRIDAILEQIPMDFTHSLRA